MSLQRFQPWSSCIDRVTYFKWAAGINKPRLIFTDSPVGNLLPPQYMGYAASWEKNFRFDLLTLEQPADRQQEDFIAGRWQYAREII